MKQFTIITICVCLFSLVACKKDRECNCVRTHTSSSGEVKITSGIQTTYTEISKSDAKSLCQKSTLVEVDEKGGVSSTINDCKLQ
ncbi:MAG: hypothetical protein PSX36_04555 [bacterium]|nr:hypothetical protein [bacterium]